ncbi:MAG: 50S ribosomal protein L18 [Bacteroidetes bacterium GWF2_38_335]|nr:MAG: 50S ribosomal protein L18 [Bacteroidetes bacterium GWF2_38_335]OFY81392.1 MAG: 50S ribosomal protein L18 [Bacteroidetes bacterium RIFOXYA12_FULL_38_20]HBS85515.1 50S ribosomal protein L18 [Bacteroidales bacterium]
MALTKQERRYRIKKRVRKVVNGTTEAPRMSVFRSNKHIAVQIIDDVTGKTLVSASSLAKDMADKKMKKIEQAEMVGNLIAKKAVEAGITTVVFDRSGYLYHGRVKSLADSARKNGLKF